MSSAPKAIEYDKAKVAAVKKVLAASPAASLTGTLAKYVASSDGIYQDTAVLQRALKGCWKGQPKTLLEFYTPEVRAAIAALWGEEEADRSGRLLALRLECIYSSSPLRRSYRSSYMGDCYNGLYGLLLSCAIWPIYDLTPAKAAAMGDAYIVGYPYRMALALREKDADAVNAAREAMLGDNSTYIITRTLIQAVIISGNRELIELLGKLLLAAKQQEGLRQQILELMDTGSAETMLYFLRLIADNDLTRFSSVIRALDTWTGLGYGDAKPALAEKCVRLAIETLSDPASIPRNVESEDALQIYFALWGTAGRELDNALPMVEQLLGSGVRYKQLTALYFAANTDNDRFAHSLALRHLDMEDEECLAWVLALLGLRFSPWYRPKDADDLDDLGGANTLSGRQQFFDGLETVVRRIGNRKQVFSGGVFPWASATLEAAIPLSWMLALAQVDRTHDMVARLLVLRENMSPDQRHTLVQALLDPALSAHRAALQEALKDRSPNVRKAAQEKLNKQGLALADVEKLCETLSTKQSSQRRDITELLSTLPDKLFSQALDILLNDGDELRLQAGLSLLLSQREKRPGLMEKYRAALPVPDGLSGQTLVLLNQLTEDARPAEYTPENGFGLFDPKAPCFTPHRPTSEAAVKKPGLLQRLLGGGALTGVELKKQIWVEEKDLTDLFARIGQVFLDHADYEYETKNWGDGSVSKVLLGNTGYSFPLPAEYADTPWPHPLEQYPFHEEFLAAAGQYATDGRLLANLFSQLDGSSYLSNIEPWFYKQMAPLDMSGAFGGNIFAKLGPQMGAVREVLNLLELRLSTPEVFAHCFKVYCALMDLLGEQNWGRRLFQNKAYSDMLPCEYPFIAYWRQKAKNFASNDDEFAFLFNHLHYESMTVGKNLRLDLGAYLRAHKLGLIPEAVVLEQLTTGRDASQFLQCISDRNRDKALFEQYPSLRGWVDAVTHRIVTLESKRGELPTPLTNCVRGVGRFEGAGYFAALLTALGKDNFFRGYEWGMDASKTSSLSYLLRHCFPAPDDTAESLAELLKKAKLKPQRLAEAAMYAPQWAPLLEQVTGWTGLKCGVWFFHAHVSEQFTAEKETEVALFSPITPQQFNDGAFDKSWFLTAYKTLGEERFQTLYKSAKYITTGSIQHRRSQLYADAVLGKLSEAELRQEVVEKRNQEKLRCYPLIPLKDEADALARYEFIRRFEHESRQFGAQRRSSEKEACRTALENLAITMDCPDVDRMLWRLEGKKLESVRALMEPQDLGGIAVSLAVGPDGVPSLSIVKDDKPQKSLPAAFKKNEAVLQLQATVKELKEQRTRARQSLENALVTGSPFLKSELEGLLGNPLLSPIASALLWSDGTQIGLPAMEGGKLLLRGTDGKAFSVTENALHLAHPHELAGAKVWGTWQRQLFEDKLIQPFKQVFREYYALTDEERAEKNLSRRYAGNQIQPKRAVALLRGRGWTVDYEEGLQKVCYDEDLVVRIYAMADWFSPAEIEPPTLEVVRFSRRSDGKPLDLEDVPPIAFSEAMRDLDLMVSVAHAGGVDPEASHSTVDMRVAIATELLRLLHVENVSFIGSHAKIHGSLGNYSVHMGSGVTHTEGVGSLVILPVQSQTRGRVFLPFADDDPKTAEIMSKILLLADDKAIKDPSILSQIK